MKFAFLVTLSFGFIWLSLGWLISSAYPTNAVFETYVLPILLLVFYGSLGIKYLKGKSDSEDEDE